jgi:hypothetical protein
MARRQCAYCGTFVDEGVKQCPDCREMIPEKIQVQTVRGGGAELRRGLIYMLLASVLYYLASPQTTIPIPFPIPPAVTSYLLPLLFLSGLGFAIFGLARRFGIV